MQEKIEMVFCYQNCSYPTERKKCSSDQKKLLKFEAEGKEFANSNSELHTVSSEDFRSLSEYEFATFYFDNKTRELARAYLLV